MDVHTFDNIVGATTDRADGETVATRAGSTAELDVGAGVDSEAVILVLHYCTGNVNAIRVANVKAISVVTTLAITQAVINVHIIHIKRLGAADAESLNRRVLNVEVVDVRVLEAVRGKELGLGLATVGALGIPPPLALALNRVARLAVNDNVGAAEGDQRSTPFLVAESRRALEDDLPVQPCLAQISIYTRFCPCLPECH